MEHVSEKAANYAAEKTNVMMTNLIAQVYEDGYRDGYKDRENEIPVNQRDNKTEYIDLGLPSGTLWSKDYERRDGNVLFLPYCEASQKNIPTKEQLEELISCCVWDCERSDNSTSGTLQMAKCVGPNGNVIYFPAKGRIFSDRIIESNEVYIWGLQDGGDNNRDALDVYTSGYDLKVQTYELFIGNKLPLRLVKAK